MEKISQSVVKKDHEPKMSGHSVYVGDYSGDGVLFGKMLRSKLARAKLLRVELPSLPEGYYYVDKNDVTGDNNVNIVLDDTPVYARDTVEYIGEPIGMVVGPDEKVVDRLLAEIKVSYEELEPVLDLRKADTVFFDYEYQKGVLKQAFAEADQVYQEEFMTGYQDQTYLEPQGMMAEPEENGHMYVHGSMLLGKSLEEARALKGEYLKAYSDKMVLTRGRVSAEYRKTVCMNLLNEFLTRFGI